MSHFIVKYFSSWIQILHQLVAMEWDSHYSHSTYNALELIRKAIYSQYCYEITNGGKGSGCCSQ